MEKREIVPWDGPRLFGEIVTKGGLRDEGDVDIDGYSAAQLPLCSLDEVAHCTIAKSS